MQVGMIHAALKEAVLTDDGLNLVLKDWRGRAYETNALCGSRTKFATMLCSISCLRIDAEFEFCFVPRRDGPAGSSYRSGGENGGNHSFVQLLLVPDRASVFYGRNIYYNAHEPGRDEP